MWKFCIPILVLKHSLRNKDMAYLEKLEDFFFPCNLFNVLSLGSLSLLLEREAGLISFLPNPQRRISQFPTWMSSPTQSFPPFLGAGALHCLVLVCFPMSHDTLQEDHFDHLLQCPSTGDERRLKNVICDFFYLWSVFVTFILQILNMSAGTLGNTVYDVWLSVSWCVEMFNTPYVWRIISRRRNHSWPELCVYSIKWVNFTVHCLVVIWRPSKISPTFHLHVK